MIHFHLYVDLHGFWRWRLMLFDQVIAVSGKSFISRADCLAMIGRIKESISNSTKVEDISGLSAPPPRQ